MKHHVIKLIFWAAYFFVGIPLLCAASMGHCDNNWKRLTVLALIIPCLPTFCRHMEETKKA